MPIRVGVGLQVPYDRMREVAVAADDLGYDSVWIPEHLVMPAAVEGSPQPGADTPPIAPDVPIYDVLVFLVILAEATERIRLGTWVYNLALRHPLVAARAAQTVDIVSGGRVVLGVGAGWLRGEYEAAGVDFSTRGRRLDECIEAVRRLWTEEQPSYAGEYVDLPPVRFEPKPAQGRVPIHVGGESDAALRRAARLGDGWIGMDHTPDSAAAQVQRLTELLDEQDRTRDEVEVTVGATPADAAELAAYADAGVDRVIVRPWRRPADAVDSLRDYTAALRPARPDRSM